MNIIIQNNEQFQSLKNYIRTNGYRIQGDHPASIDNDMVFSIDDTNKFVSCSPASSMLLDSNNAIYSLHRFFDIKSRENPSHSKEIVEKDKNNTIDMPVSKSKQQSFSTKGLAVFIDLAMKSTEYPLDNFKNLLSPDLFFVTKSDYSTPSTQTYIFKDYPGLSFSIQGTKLSIGVLQNTISNALKLQYYKPNELQLNEIRPVVFTKENVIKYVQEIDFHSISKLGLHSMLPMQLHYDNEVRKTFYEKIEELSFIIPKHLSDKVTDIASPALYPYASIYFLNLLKMYKGNDIFMENGMRYLNEHFTDETQQLYEHYTQLNYYCDHADAYRTILDYNLEYPSFEEKKALKRSIFLLENSINTSIFNEEKIKKEATKIESNPFLAFTSKKKLLDFAEKKDELKKKIEHDRVNLSVENKKLIDLMEKEKRLDSKISEEEKNLKYEFEILHDAEVFGSLSLKLAMIPTLESQKLYLDLIREKQNSIKILYNEYSEIHGESQQISAPENEYNGPYINAKSDLEIDM